MAYEQASVIEQSNSLTDVLARNKCLRQTYMLLAVNLLFSAICAFAGMALKVGPINPIIHLVAFIGLSLLVAKNANNGFGIVFLFAFTGFLGFALSNVLSMYIAIGAGDVVVKALFGTAVLFGSLSVYAIVSGKNFSFLGGFLFCGMIVALLAAIANLFLHIPVLSVAISAAVLLIFSGYVLYDTSNIVNNGERNYIIATLQLFINIYNIFVSLLNILMALRD
ncbi:MAG: Bax inhibitor-1/YccA family protein [Cardiobacteriaceae bacterium]|nr:Bax inhibitor-1/YccA family protein [Cardiobacteriaceae bacterium]